MTSLIKVRRVVGSWLITAYSVPMRLVDRLQCLLQSITGISVCAAIRIHVLLAANLVFYGLVVWAGMYFMAAVIQRRISLEVATLVVALALPPVTLLLKVTTSAFNKEATRYRKFKSYLNNVDIVRKGIQL